MYRSPRDVLNAFIRECDAEMCPNVPSSPASTPEKSAQLCPNVPDGAPSTQNCKTNPPRPRAITLDKPLSLRQLHAARLLVLGLGVKRVAKQLGLNHHTIARWKRDSRFTAVIDKHTRALDAGTPGLAKTTT